MPRATLVLAIHDHQPVGNFPHVFREAYESCYRRFLDLAGKHERVKLALHYTGPLLEWLEENAPGFLDDLKALVARGQVELLGGGFYEPMLATLTDSDAWGQLAMMAEYAAERLGARPTGMWLAERVWEPDLPRIITQAGYRYTFLDDAHFLASGLARPAVHGHFVTEKAGAPLAIFPIDQGLRYRIPFAPVEEVLEYFSGRAGQTLTYGDDGEKFGLWPGTREWCWEKGWLERFFEALSTSEEIVQTALPSEVLARDRPQGRVYLPTASYAEMQEWALPPEAARRYRDFVHELEALGRLEEVRPFVRGGIWQSFLAKYPESNQLHKKMLHVSRKLAEAEALEGVDVNALARARRELFRGQCNCAYWHGVFGGLYLNALRHATYSALLEAESIIDETVQGSGDFISYEEADLDCDLADEALIANAHVWTQIVPAVGGGVAELDIRARSFNLLDVLSRRREAFHDRLAEASRPESAGEGPRTVRDGVRVKEPGLDKVVVDDAHRRLSFLDRFQAPGLGFEALVRGDEGERGDFSQGVYTLMDGGVDESGDYSARAVLRREGRVNGQKVVVQKTYRVPIDQGRLEVEIVVENVSADRLEAVFATELNVTLLAGDAPDRYIELAGGRRHRPSWRGTADALPGLTLVDAWAGFKAVLTSETPFELWCHPLETVSQSEAGFERTFQGSCLLLRAPLSLEPGVSARIAWRLELVPFTATEADRA